MGIITGLCHFLGPRIPFIVFRIANCQQFRPSPNAPSFLVPGIVSLSPRSLDFQTIALVRQPTDVTTHRTASESRSNTTIPRTQLEKIGPNLAAPHALFVRRNGPWPNQSAVCHSLRQLCPPHVAHVASNTFLCCSVPRLKLSEWNSKHNLQRPQLQLLRLMLRLQLQ